MRLGVKKYSSYSFLTSTLDGDEWSLYSVTPRPLFTPGPHGVSQAGLDAEAAEKSSHLCQVSNLDRPVVQFVASHYTDWAAPAVDSIVRYIFNNLFCYKTLLSNM
jgi:hypothetical protein